MVVFKRGFIYLMSFVPCHFVPPLLIGKVKVDHVFLDLLAEKSDSNAFL